ncbi:MAG: CDP-alcohol phosphatidyltransferase family protein [Flavobacteriales bacterium]|nr:CDP-alcohol phosphatidyltransferase family protein [Flavobacteriales bacterium]
MKKAIPNTLTLCNLICGCFGIVCAFNNQLDWAGYFIGIAAIFDFLDGFSARLLNAKSAIGAQLDSLADMVTFGVLPAIIMFQLLSISFGEYFTVFSERPIDHMFVQSLAFLIAAFSALRLAKFNVDDSQTDSFVGMPTPAIAIFIGSLPIILNGLDFNFYNYLTEDMLLVVDKVQYWSDIDAWVVSSLQSSTVLAVIAIFCSVLLVVPVRMLALKFKGFGWQNNKQIFVFLILVSVLTIYAIVAYSFYLSGLPDIGLMVIPLVIVIYPIYSILMNTFAGKEN